MAVPKDNDVRVGDCVELMGQLEEGSVDLVFADPPFNINYKYDKYQDDKSIPAYVNWTEKWLKAAHRVLAPNGSIWVAIGDEMAAEVCCELKKRFFQRNWVVWYYTFGVHTNKKFGRSHTHLLYFTKHPKVFTFNRRSVSVPSARMTTYADRRAAEGGKIPDDTWILRPQDVPTSFVPGHDVWYFPRVAGTHKARQTFMTTHMPERVLGRIIEACSDQDDLVLDPFLGSGTTAVVAKKLRRRYLGFDISKDYVRQARERLSRARAGQSLEGAADPRVSAPKTRKGRRRVL